jgi:tRNA-specific adenosine deaminase 3
VREAFEHAKENVIGLAEVEEVSKRRNRDLESFDSAVKSHVVILEDLPRLPKSGNMPRQQLDSLSVSREKIVADIGHNESGNFEAARGCLVDSEEAASKNAASSSDQGSQKDISKENVSKESKYYAPSAQISQSNVLDNDHASASTPTHSRVSSEDVTPTELFLILGTTNAISHAAVAEALSAVVNDATIFSIQVPRLAPTSQEQASLWSSQYWPTVYKKSNPFGPHPSIVSRTELEFRGEVDKWMNLASEVAHQACLAGSGERVGVVIVERKNGVGRRIAVAGDARWECWPRNGSGNVTAHAALRAIAMVAARLKSINETEQSTSTMLASATHLEVEMIPADQMIRDGTVLSNKEVYTDGAFMHAGEEKQVQSHSKAVISRGSCSIFQDKPFLAAEKDHYDESGTKAGYLCHELEIYCTHEPCVMCSMAIVHSRFGKVAFQHRMPRTGAMCADGDLGHGLFWRKELNWTLLAWQWLVLKDDHKIGSGDFHA